MEDENESEPAGEQWPEYFKTRFFSELRAEAHAQRRGPHVAKELYRLAMRGGQDTEDFSVVYEYLSNGSAGATVDQTPSTPTKAQLQQAN